MSVYYKADIYLGHFLFCGTIFIENEKGVVTMVKRTDWTKDEIKDLLLKNNRMVIKSLLKLCEYQTDDELEFKEANVRNRLGFNKFDAPILTNVADIYTKTGQISRKSFADTRRRLLKYSSQLAKIANGVI